MANICAWWTNNLAIVTAMKPGLQMGFQDIYRGLGDFDFGLLTKPTERTAHRHLAWLMHRDIVIPRQDGAYNWWTYEIGRKKRNQYMETVPVFLESAELLNIFLQNNLPRSNKWQKLKRAKTKSNLP